MPACSICRLAGKQEAQQRNPHYLYEKIKKQLTEKEEQYKKEKQQLERRLGAQDMELRHLRNDINKVNLLVKIHTSKLFSIM